MKKFVAVLLTCHNRREKTLSCLNSLYAATLPANHLLTIFLVDDGSNDGTAAAVTKEFPEVRILQGNGELYWNRGMHLAWQTAQEAADFDFYLWLNDDVKIKPNGIEVLLNNHENYPNSIIAGVMASEVDGKITYGGFDKNEKQIVFDAKEPLPCFYINGNMVLVPKIVKDKTGILDPMFPHATGDFEYGLRARKNGFETRISSGIVGYCESNPLPPAWQRPEVSLIKRAKSLYAPTGYCHPFYFFRYELRHFGIFRAVKHFFTLHLRMLMPSLWITKSV
ncbi:glycosyltransferase family 2 protein [Cellulophaga tyrosinoxydans]|uniref:Glycosyltransferase, GT2 family n=1 Tax=Cellulophaga tyrosinoxydans TaxID=504486 RepID=A0A1W2ARP7_9FLAO|nr:glycosyltransferase family 2 protein [Cellulophaga tyrosinoxydans]SMC62878.1 Glycosyltransferase, GT2 family [Cellulophaga tyrosinoxydans]